MRWYQRRVHGERGQGSITTTMNAVSLLVVLFAVAASAEEEVARKLKLFFVSTSATTTTLQTLSICFVSSNSITTCTGRKRRAINMDGGLSLEDAASVEVEPSQREQDASAPAIDGSRDGRFLLYWITTTSISTSTSFTTTYSVSSALRTAPGANLCGQTKNNQISCLVF